VLKGAGVCGCAGATHGQDGFEDFNGTPHALDRDAGLKLVASGIDLRMRELDIMLSVKRYCDCLSTV
jgi:hypothetical protein